MRKLSALLLVLCMLCAALPAFGDAAEPYPVRVGDMTFTFPAGVTSTDAQGEAVVVNYPDYFILLICRDWTGKNIDVTRGDVHDDNMYMLLTQGIDATPSNAATMISRTGRSDIALDGNPLLMAATTGGLFVSHYYRDHGYLLVIMPADGYMEDYSVYIGTVYTIFKSFRIDGVSEEQMAEDDAADMVAITADSAKIRSEASISGGLIKTAYKGESYELIREEGDWYVVNVNGREGYIHKGVAAIQ